MNQPDSWWGCCLDCWRKTSSSPSHLRSTKTPSARYGVCVCVCVCVCEERYIVFPRQTHHVQLGAVLTLGHVTSAGVARINKTKAEEGEESVVMETTPLGQFEEFVQKSLQRLGQ